ncbi:MAG: hypothetical protein JXA28_15080 [Bacteroidetes bacterium]|nr:hypothetical protein [Bacteroidota bacterium]
MRLQRRSGRFFRLRIGLFLLFLVGIGLPASTTLRVTVAAAAAAVFAGVAVLHRRVDNSIARHRAWKAIKHSQDARCELDWEKLPPAVPYPLPDDHPFAADLDLFGAASLHRLMDISVSRRGSALLADWLADPAPLRSTIRERQETVRALAPLVHFREHLLVTYAMVTREKLDGDAFLHWLRNAALPASIRWVLPVSLVLSALNIALFFLWGFNVLGPYFLVGILVYGSVYFLNTDVREVFLGTAIRLDDELGRLKTVFDFLERYPSAGRPALEELIAVFRREDERPSRHIRRILHDVVAAGVSMNPVMMVLLNLAFPWDFFFASRLERKRLVLEQLLPRWLDALHRLEALQSLANFAGLHPEYVFPEIVEPAAEDAESIERSSVLPEMFVDPDAALSRHSSLTASAVFNAKALGHPLIPKDTRVCNDFRVDSIGRIFLVTGSNMSGKSTFLRTVGINMVLAYAGGPVVAESLKVQLFRLYTCIQISDSLREGVSYFYAEVRRLRALLTRLDADEAEPLFFLIDEIFKGTNNIERHVGSESYLRALAGRHGTGIVSTHDIELTVLPEQIPAMVNLHFREHIRDGEMRFDYRLRPGPCPTTNALVIMRLEGLPVPGGGEGVKG